MNEEFIWWPAICDQFKIEFGVEMETRFGGNIANLMYSIHALVDGVKGAGEMTQVTDPEIEQFLDSLPFNVGWNKSDARIRLLALIQTELNDPLQKIAQLERALASHAPSASPDICEKCGQEVIDGHGAAWARRRMCGPLFLFKSLADKVEDGEVSIDSLCEEEVHARGVQFSSLSHGHEKCGCNQPVYPHCEFCGSPLNNEKCPEKGGN